MVKSSGPRISGAFVGAFLTLFGLVMIGCGGGGGGGGSTTGLPTDGSTDGTPTTGTPTTGTPTPGVLPSNVIFYNLASDDGSTDVRYIQPTGSGDNRYELLSPLFQGLALNPVNNTQRVFGYHETDSAQFGVYKNNAVSASGKVELVSPQYDAVLSLQMSPDGNTVYYIAIPHNSAAANLYKVAIGGGTPTLLDQAEDFSLNPAGDKLIYSKLTGADVTTELYVRGVNAGDVATRLTNNSVEDEFAQWSKDGTKIAFTHGDSTGLHIYTMTPTVGATPTQITSGTTSNEFTPSFNATGDQISYVSIDTSATPSRVLYRNSATGVNVGKTQVKTDDALFVGTYWTGASGRGHITAMGRLTERVRRHDDLLKLKK